MMQRMLSTVLMFYNNKKTFACCLMSFCSLKAGIINQQMPKIDKTSQNQIYKPVVRIGNNVNKHRSTWKQSFQTYLSWNQTCALLFLGSHNSTARATFLLPVLPRQLDELGMFDDSFKLSNATRNELAHKKIFRANLPFNQAMMHLGSLTRRIVMASHRGGIGQIAYAGEFQKCLSTQTKAKLDAVVDLVKQ